MKMDAQNYDERENVHAFMDMLSRNRRLVFEDFFDIEGYSLSRYVTEVVNESLVEKTVHNSCFGLADSFNAIEKNSMYPSNVYATSHNVIKNVPRPHTNVSYDENGKHIVAIVRSNYNSQEFGGKTSTIRSSVGYSNPPFCRSLPSEIGNFRGLLVLNLTNSGICGPIPTSIGLLESLVQLQLAHNKIIGPLPDSMSNLQSLEILDLTDNSITGKIPAGFGNLTSLRMLYLSGNSFVGSIPDAICNLSLLSRLTLDRNFLSGQLPRDLSRLASLELLSISHNRFADDANSMLHQLDIPTALKWFYCDDNRFLNPALSAMALKKLLPSLQIDA